MDNSIVVAAKARDIACDTDVIHMQYVLVKATRCLVMSSESVIVIHH